ncbi:hypothetical protein L484_001321 [Morus notabilis]|uniref:Retrotransposon gag domain-containing protein n=1 Tax=Morus notabilis TaxID=981085 RepID=W9QEK0_9ROSA|nr:hypothetical protein L484_001321 [Morus notabilis]
MDGRVEVVEKDVGELKGVVGQLSVDMGAMKEYMKELTDWMRSGNGANPPAEWTRAYALNDVEGGRATGAAFHPNYGAAQSGGELRFHRMEIPLFSGDDPLGWLFWLERYFQVQGVEEAKRVAAAVIDSSVVEFHEKFKLLSSPLREADEEFLMGAFSNGLAEEIRAEVHMVKPASLVQLTDLP